MRLTKKTAGQIGFFVNAWIFFEKKTFHGKYERTWMLYPLIDKDGYNLSWNSKLEICIPGYVYDLDKSVPVFTTKHILKIMSLYG